MTPFTPPQRLLMGPGPSDVSPRVLAAMSRPTIGHLDPAFVTLMDEIKDLLRYAFQTQHTLTMPVSAPGSAGMECAFVNLVEPGDTIIVARNGVFGQRMTENVIRCGATAITTDDPWGQPVDPNKVADALKAHPEAKAVAFVHAETSTGVQSDAATLCALARQHNALSIVDAVTSLAGIPVPVDEWQADVVYSGSQKCLSCAPGLSPITFSAAAVDRIKGRNTPVQSWFLDINLVLGYWGSGGKRSYHHTAPVNALYGLHEALLMVREETLEAAWKRHATLHQALRAGLEAMGLSLPVAPQHRLPQLNAVTTPENIDEAAVRATLLNDYGLEIGAGLGASAGKLWRIGLMGQSATKRHVLTCLAALETTLSKHGAKLPKGAALAAAEAELANSGKGE